MKISITLLAAAIGLTPAITYAQPGVARQQGAARRQNQPAQAPEAPTKRNFQGIAPNSSGQANAGNLGGGSDFFNQGNSGGGGIPNSGGGGIANSGGGGRVLQQQNSGSSLQNFPPSNFQSSGGGRLPQSGGNLSQFNQPQQFNNQPQFNQNQLNQGQFNQSQFNQPQRLQSNNQRLQQSNAGSVQPNDLPGFNPQFDQGGVQLPQNGGQRLQQSNLQGAPRVNQQQQGFSQDLPQDGLANSNFSGGNFSGGQVQQFSGGQGQQFGPSQARLNVPTSQQHSAMPFSDPSRSNVIRHEDFSQFHSQSISNYGYGYDPEYGLEPVYSNQPIQIVCPEGIAGQCHYELIHPSGAVYPYDISGGEAQQFLESTEWQIRYEPSHGGGYQTYRLRGGKQYTLRRNPQGLWQLYSGS